MSQIPTRYNFEFFYENNNRTVREAELDTFLLEKGGMTFVGKQLRVDDIILTYYIAPFDDRTALICLYLSDGEPFDTLVENLDEDNIEAVHEAWPKMLEALINANNDYSNAPCLLNPGEMFWGLCTQVENVDIDDYDDEYVVKKTLDLIDYAIEMINEFEENEISEDSDLEMLVRKFDEGLNLGNAIGNIIDLGKSILGFDD